MTTTEAELKACPFCGGTDIESEDSGINGEGYMRCQTCWAAGPQVQNPDGVAKAFAAWNGRRVRFVDAWEAVETVDLSQVP
jgi:Lar family restriction alleviation protein